MVEQKTRRGTVFTNFRAPALPGIVKNIMEIKGVGHSVSLRLYPRNTPEILVNLGKPVPGRLEDHTLIANGTTIQGSKKMFMEVAHPAKCHFLSIRFTPNAFYKLFGLSQEAFTNNLFQLDDVIDDTVHLIPELKNASTTRERFQRLNESLQQLISQRGVHTNLLSDFILDQLSMDPTLTVSELTTRTGYTRKHLAESFKREAGLTIKQYQKIERIYQILKRIEKQGDLSWSKVACEFGFYDQSHLIRDFKRFTGYTPTEYCGRAIGK